ncbi:MAG: MSHA biogenesis protein MshJ [Motiliproteus sp.]|jgi:MSHA biogenesis protein MshJ
MDNVRSWAASFNAMSLRERVLILIVLLVALAFPAFSYWIEPAQQQSATQTSTRLNLQSASAQATLDYAMAEALVVKDPNEALQGQIQVFMGQIEVLEKQQKLSTAAMVKPLEMVELLQQILRKHQGVRVLSVHKATPIRIDISETETETETQEAAAVALGIFRHDLKLVLEGGFFEVQGFLQAVEQSNKSLFWDSIDYQVGGYPKARVTLLMYTLSSTKEWLGV